MQSSPLFKPPFLLFCTTSCVCVHTYQVCCGLPLQGMNGLPETGVSDAATWQTLLGGAAQPADLVNLSANNAQYDDDMSGHSDSVWLLVCILVAYEVASTEMYIRRTALPLVCCWRHPAGSCARR